MTFLKSFSKSEPKFDSAKVSPRVSLAHKITKEGPYSCRVVNSVGQGRRFNITVGADRVAGQALVDCDELFAPDAPTRDIKVGVEDYLLFVSTHGNGEYAVEITTSDEIARVEFDSKAVGIDGLIVLNPLLPGTYVLTNTHSGVTASLIVTPLEDLFEDPMSDEAVKFYESLREEGALQVSLSETAFSPDPIKLDADRPMVLTGSGPMRVECALREAHSLSGILK